MRDFFKRHWRAVVLGAACLLPFTGSLLLARHGAIFVSPDETANYFFSSRVAEHGTFKAYEPLNIPLHDALVPRSMVARAGYLLPGSFIGLPFLYGAALKAFGLWIAAFLTPLFAAAGVIAWWKVCRKWFGERIGFFSALLLALHPAWWYYASRGWLHNVLFVSILLFIAFNVFSDRLLLSDSDRAKSRTVRTMVGSGYWMTLALLVRTAEAPWVLTLFVVGTFLAGRQLKPKPVLGFCYGVAVGALLALLLTHWTYGSWFATGYSIPAASSAALNPDLAPAPLALDAPSWWNGFQHLIAPLFPFGFHPRNVIRTVGNYGVGLFWWMSALCLVGLPLVWKTMKTVGRRYVAAFAFVAAYLGVFYGSWTIQDNPDASAVTIGNSYVRYWLPVFAMSTVFAATGLAWIADRARTPLAKKLATVALCVLCLGLSVRSAVFSSDDALAGSDAALARDAAVRADALTVIPTDAVVIVDRADKVFFPHWRVRVPLRSEETYALMPKILDQGVRLYYYGIAFPPDDLDYLNGQKLKAMGLRIDEVKRYGQEALYEIHR